MKPILEVRNLSKKYRIQHQIGGYLNLRERLLNLFTFQHQETEDFWALDDISFDVEAGETIGIIGRNGAGKSTLLKILSRITPPTTGKIISRGRIASLLEVGTGFHPELTGRENIYLNGSLLGMKRKDIEVKFDEIVDFSGVEKFLDTPLKHYSSGMQLRLAFAVAAFLEPEILIIDEVLAVGDAEFQRKCLGKMEDVTQNKGRTIIFVSHNMNAVKLLCRNGFHLTKGKSSDKLKIDDAIALYSTSDSQLNNSFPIMRDKINVYNIQVTQNAELRSEFSGDFPIDLTLDFEVTKNLSAFRIGFYLKNQWGELIARKFPSDWQSDLENIKAGRYLLRSQLPKSFLTSGHYTLEVHASIFGVQDFGLEEVTQIKMLINSPANFNQVRLGEKTFPGYLLWNGDFSIQKVN